ncbi:CD63 antigen-like isoform X2 [Sitophilus oryzae]|uniref:CD63 antigen-like isoform X2 n=1 Tax=Sitophilus oryzae TaxID=7048 RepID=A0A6J2Y8Q8_SITOR|nr:CD63 antigen-like isoform X2 [Sitophilus oryzae]
MKAITWILFLLSCGLTITGIIILAVGATVKTVYTEYSYFLDDKYFSLPNMLIATGAIIFFISFFGCCGAFKESWVMLSIFSVLLVVVFIFEFSAGIAGYVLRDKTISYLENTLQENLKSYNSSTHDIWDLIQSKFECCGATSYEDWSTVLSGYQLPVSCCPEKSGTTGVFYCNSYTTSATTTSTTQSITEGSSTTSVSTSSTTEAVSSTTAASTTSTAEASSSTTTASPASTTEASSSTASVSTSSTSESTIPSSTAEPNPLPSGPGRRRRDVLAEDPTPTTPPPESTSTPYQTGCATAFGSFIKKHAVQIGGCALGLAIIQILGIIFSCYMVRQLKNSYYST